MSISKHTHIDVKLEISSPVIEIKNKTSLFEKEVMGKNAMDAHNITSRIDTFTSIAHTIAMQTAVENAFGIIPSKSTSSLREIMIKSEIVYSHLSHIFLKIIPRIHGVQSVFEFIKKNEKEYAKNNEVLLKLEKSLTILSKRYPHPINSAVGGYFKPIVEEEKKEIVRILKDTISHCINVADILSKNLKYNNEIIDNYSSLWDLDTTPVLSGRIRKKDEEGVLPKDFYQKFNHKESSYVGPIARLNNNRKLLSFTSERLVKKYGLKFPLNNSYQAPLCMAIEAIHLSEQIIESLQKTSFESEQMQKPENQEGTGVSCVEGAKGTIYYELEIEKDSITKARIITPIDQNERFLQKAIKNIPFDPDKKTRKQLLDEIDLLIEMFYL